MPTSTCECLRGEKKTQNGCVGKCRLTEGMTGTLFSIFFRLTERARETVREKERGGKLRLSVSLSHSERHRFFCSLTTSTPKQIRLLQSTVYSAYLPASASLCSRTSLSPRLSLPLALSPRVSFHSFIPRSASCKAASAAEGHGAPPALGGGTWKARSDHGGVDNPQRSSSEALPLGSTL